MSDTFCRAHCHSCLSNYLSLRNQFFTGPSTTLSRSSMSSSTSAPTSVGPKLLAHSRNFGNFRAFQWPRGSILYIACNAWEQIKCPPLFYSNFASYPTSQNILTISEPVPPSCVRPFTPQLHQWSSL